MRSSFAATLGAFLLLAPFVSATTWVVDDDGGAGVDFTSIADAVAAAGPGDVILVRAGTYSGFTLDYGASILGDPGVLVTSLVQISGLPTTPRAALAGLSLRTLRIQSCAAPVTIEDSTVEPLEANFSGIQGMVSIDQSADVRLRKVTVRHLGTTWERKPAVHAANSRVEISGSRLEGCDGITCGWDYPGNAQAGASALIGAAGADLHVATSSLFGGYGGDAQAVECQSDDAGDGKPGIELLAGAAALVSGRAADTIVGGAQGVANACNTDGEPGNGILVGPGATLRVSGVTITGESYYPGCGGSAAAIAGVYTQAVPADPTLSFTGTQLPGQILTFRLRGAPGDAAQLVIGRQLTVVDLPNVVEDQLLVPLRTFNMGTLPASGTGIRSIVVPAEWVPGQMLVAQGRTTTPLGAVSLTHSLPIVVR